jgi:hypothetical protein
MMTMVEARFAIEAELLARRATVRDWRFIAYPSNGTLVLACAELDDGGEVQQLFALDAPIDPDDYNEWDMARRFFALPSTALH